MQIDWITVAAQVANFLVLVWLLQRFLYRPIVRAMERREQRIADRLQRAEAERVAAEAEGRSYRQKSEALESAKTRLLDEAQSAAETRRRSLEHAAREEVAAKQRAWMQQLDKERETFLHDLRRESLDRFFAISRAALKEIADTRLEDQIAEIFVNRLEALGASARKKLADAAGEAGGIVLVASRFALEAGHKRTITKAIHERILDGVEVRYEERAEMLCGIELSAGGQKLSWSLESYFDSLEHAVASKLGASALASGEAPA